jgi:hypothetical protein
MTRLTYQGKEYVLEGGNPLSLADFTFTLQASGHRESIVLVEGAFVHDINYPLNEVRSYLTEEIACLARKLLISERDALDLKNYQKDLEDFQQSSSQSFTVMAHTFLTIVYDRAYNFTHGDMQFTIDMGSTRPFRAAVPLELRVTDSKHFFIQCVSIFKQYTDVAISSMVIQDSYTLKAASDHRWQVVPLTPRAEFKPAFLYVLTEGAETQQFDVNSLECEFELDVKQDLKIGWVRDKFELSMQDDGEIPRLVAEKRNVALFGTKACKSREDQRTLERLMEIAADRPSTAETRSEVRALTEAVRRERERGRIYSSTFNAVPSGGGEIVSSWTMSWDQPVKIKRWVCSNGKNVNLNVTMVVTDKQTPFDAVSLRVATIPFAEVKRTFVPYDDDLDVSGETFVEILPVEGSPVFSPSAPAPFHADDFSPSLIPGEAAFNDILHAVMSPLSLAPENGVHDIPTLSLEARTHSKSSKSPKHVKKARPSPY